MHRYALASNRPLTLLIGLGLTCLFPCAVGHAAQDAATPVAISATDPMIRYVGRFDRRDPAGPRCNWSASEVDLKFRGSTLDADLSDTGNDEYEVVVDGMPKVLTLTNGLGHYNLFTATTSGTHTVTLVKRTEPFVGVTQFRGFQLSAGGTLLGVPARKHRLEVVGDSISCGYGNEGTDRNVHFSPTTENAYETYGAIAARAVDADYTCLAWSGRKMWPDNTMDSIYGLTIATDAASTWDFSRWTPEVVVITLATNDFGKGAPDQKGWTGGYEAFLNRVHKNYPKAAIYCATSPMMSGDSKATSRAYLNQIIADQKAAGYDNVRLLEFETQQDKDGIGSDWHPSIKTHEIMAAKLTSALETDMGWKATP